MSKLYKTISDNFKKIVKNPVKYASAGLAGLFLYGCTSTKFLELNRRMNQEPQKLNGLEKKVNPEQMDWNVAKIVDRFEITGNENIKDYFRDLGIPDEQAIEFMKKDGILRLTLEKDSTNKAIFYGILGTAGTAALIYLIKTIADNQEEKSDEWAESGSGGH